MRQLRHKSHFSIIHHQLPPLTLIDNNTLAEKWYVKISDKYVRVWRDTNNIAQEWIGLFERHI